MEIVVENTTDLGDSALLEPKKYNGFMGVSIRNKFFSKKNMHVYLKWASSHFKEFVILLMDDPDNHNLEILKNLPKEDALLKAREISDDIKSGYEKLLKNLNITNVKILQFRDFIHDENYQNILSVIKKFFSQNTSFSENLLDLMEINIGEKIARFIIENNIPDEHKDKIRQKLSQYIIEELASLIYLTEKGYTIEVDPTHELPTKEFLYENKFTSFNTLIQLGKRGHIFAYPKGTSYHTATYKE